MILSLCPCPRNVIIGIAIFCSISYILQDYYYNTSFNIFLIRIRFRKLCVCVYVNCRIIFFQVPRCIPLAFAFRNIGFLYFWKGDPGPVGKETGQLVREQQFYFWEFTSKLINKAFRIVPVKFPRSRKTFVLKFRWVSVPLWRGYLLFNMTFTWL